MPAPFPSSFLLAFIAEQASYGTEYLFGQFESWPCSLSGPWPFPSYCWRGQRVGTDAVPVLLSSKQSTGVLLTPFQLPVQSSAL